MKIFLYKQREILALLTFVAIVSGSVYFVVIPLLARMNGINDQIQQESVNQESVRLHISELPKIQQQYETLQKNGDLGNILLDRNKAVILIEKLEKLAEVTNNKITISVQDNNTPTKKVTAKETAALADTLMGGLPSADYLQLKIILSGDYKSIVGFVSLLEKFEYYSDITAIQINNEQVDLKSRQSISSGGMFDTALSATNGTSSNVSNKTDSTLTASLDTVFYTN